MTTANTHDGAYGDLRLLPLRTGYDDDGKIIFLPPERPADRAFASDDRDGTAEPNDVQEAASRRMRALLGSLIEAAQNSTPAPSKD